MKKILCSILLLALSFPLALQAKLKNVPKIKVRIAHSKQKVLISGHQLNRYIWPKRSWKTYKKFKKIQFNCKSKTNFKRKKPIRLALVKSNKGFVSINYKKYKGTFHIQTSERFNGCDVINELSLEDYLSTLLPKEMNSSWPIEALKAQAVAARSYAYYKIKTNQVSKTKGFITNYHLESSEKHQVSGSYQDATKKTIKATHKTRGEILTLQNRKVTPIFFHSKCGGKTLTPDQVWKNKVPGYTSVDCPFCHKHGKKDWKRKWNKPKLARSLQRVLNKYNKTKLALKKHKYYIEESGQVDSHIHLLEANSPEVTVGELIKKSRLRGVLGRAELPSNHFSLKDNGKTIEVQGSGFGHGVGMCQFGVKELALQGFSYKKILAYYFPELKLKKLY